MDVDTYPSEATIATQLFESIVKDSDGVEALTISEHGEPSGGRGHQDWASGWFATSVADVPDRNIGGSYRWTHKGQTEGSGIFLGEQMRAAYDWAWSGSGYAPLGPDVARRRYLADIAMAEAAKQIGCHILVSNRDQFHLGKPTPLVDIPVCRLPAAVAIASLHRRLSGEFTPWRVPGGLANTTRIAFYQQTAFALLPEWWRLLAHIPDDRVKILVELALAIPRRVAKALRIRDECLATITYRPTGTVFELIGEEIESLATALQGAFDSLAETCNELWGANLERHQIGLQTKAFRSELRRRNGTKALVWLDDKSTRSYAVFELVKELRNAVHRNSLAGVSFRERPYDFPSTMYPLPRGLTDEALQRTIRLLGGRIVAGPDDGREVVVPPEDLIDVAIYDSCEVLNGLMQQVPLAIGGADRPYQPHPDYVLSQFGIEQLALQMGIAAERFKRRAGQGEPQPLNS